MVLIYICKVLYFLKYVSDFISTVNWATISDANKLKTKHDVHRYVIQAIMELLQSLKNVNMIGLPNPDQYFNYFTEIATILYEKCILRLNEFIDFDSCTAIMAVECFHMILNMVNVNYSKKWQLFLKNMCKLIY